MTPRPSTPRRLLADLGAYGVGDFLIFGLGYFVLLPVLTRHLSIEEYGVVATLTAVSVFLVGILQFGLPSAVFRLYFLRETTEARQTYFGNTCVFGLIAAACVSALLSLLGERAWDSIIRNAPFHLYGGYIIWGAFFQVVTVFVSVLLRAMERPRLFVALGVAQSACLIVMVVYHVVVMREGALGQVRAVFFTYVILAAVSSIVIVRNVHWRLSAVDIRDSLRFGGPIFLTYLVGFFASRANVVILQFFVVGSAVGLFALGQQLGSVIILVSAAVDKAWQPFLYGQDPKGAQSLVEGFTPIAAMFYAILAVGLALFAPEVVALLSSHEYAGAWPIVVVSSLGAALAAIGSVTGGALYYARRSDVTMWITVAAAAANVTLTLLLAPKLGALGASFAWALSGLVTVGLCVGAMRRYAQVQVDGMRLAAVIGLGVLTVCAVSLACRSWPAISLGVALAIKATALIGYVAVLWVAGLRSSKNDAVFFQFIQTLSVRSGRNASGTSR